jgi:uncharacterized protein YcbX
MAGTTPVEAAVEPWGLRNDRRWMVVDPTGTVLTAREERSLFAISTRTDAREGSVTLRALGFEPLTVPQPADGPLIAVGISRLGSARDAGPVAADWISDAIGRPAVLVWLDDPRRRAVGSTHGGRPGDSVSLADTGPVLVTTQASLEQLNDWMVETAEQLGEGPPEPVLMERFRPNVVITGSEAFAEDSWGQIRVGQVTLRAAELCDRCVMTTIDPHTRLGGKEPLRTLARRRRWDGTVWFGLRLIPTVLGVVRVGDPVSLL